MRRTIGRNRVLLRHELVKTDPLHQSFAVVAAGLDLGTGEAALPRADMDTLEVSSEAEVAGDGGLGGGG